MKALTRIFAALCVALDLAGVASADHGARIDATGTDEVLTILSTTGDLVPSSDERNPGRSAHAVLNYPNFVEICSQRAPRARLNLFGEIIQVSKIAVQRNQGGFTWFGSIHGQPGTVVLTSVEGYFRGTVDVHDRTFSLRQVDRAGFRSLQELNITEVPPGGYGEIGEAIHVLNPETDDIRNLPRDGRYRAAIWYPMEDLERIINPSLNDYDIGRIPVEVGKLPPQYDGYKLLPDDGTVIDVLVVLTDAAVDYAGGAAAAGVYSQHAVDLTNIALLQSGVNTWLNMLAPHHSSYQFDAEDDAEDKPTIDEVLAALIDPNDGAYDEVHDWRDQDAADIIVVIGGHDAFHGIHGGAITPTKSTSVTDAAEAAIAIYNSDSAWSDLNYFAHELGHVLGVSHDWYADNERANDPPPPNEPPFDPYAYDLDAHGFTTQAVTPLGSSQAREYLSIMAYATECRGDLGPPPDGGFDPCVWHRYFSNPDIFVPLNLIPNDGVSPDSYLALGRALPEAEAANAVRVINGNVKNIANYRLSACRLFPSHQWCP